MLRTHAMTVGLALVLLGLASTLGFAQEDSPYSRGVVATITALDAQTDMATLKTEEGEVFELPQRSLWHVGYTVECDRIIAARPRLQNCQPWESAHGARDATAAPRAGRFADTEPPQRADQTDIRNDVGVFDRRIPVPGDDQAQ